MFDRSTRGGGINGRLIMAAIVAVMALVTYFGNNVMNPVTNENQHIDMTVQQEVALGLQAAPEVAAEYGGPSQNAQGQATVSNVGQRLVSRSEAGKSPYQYQFHLLADQKTINAFALPGGQVFITEALLQRLQTEGQLAGVLAHEITHVVARHSAEQVAKQQLTQGLTGAAVLATYDPNDPSSQQSAAVAALVAQLATLKFSRSDELEADRLGVRWMSEAGYDPRAMVQVMQILEQASQGNGPPEFFSTHPNPENRIGQIQQAIKAEYPNGVPGGLTQ